SDNAWARGSLIQVQVSRARRLLPPETHGLVDAAQEAVVTFLDHKVDQFRAPKASLSDWQGLREALETELRPMIEELLRDLIQELNLQQGLESRLWHGLKRNLGFGAVPSELDDKLKRLDERLTNSLARAEVSPA